MIHDSLQPLLNKDRIGILDGGLATHLEDALSQSISSSPLWSASLLDTNPISISKAHQDFLKSGSQIISTANYQSSSDAFLKVGYELNKSEELMKLAVKLASDERDNFLRKRNDGEEKKILVALSLGPYGALLGNGSEYTGDYSSPITSNNQPTLKELMKFHLNRLRIFIQEFEIWEKIDLIAFETLPRLDEVLAIKLALKTIFEEIGEKNLIREKERKELKKFELKPCFFSFVFPDGKNLPWNWKVQDQEIDKKAVVFEDGKTDDDDDDEIKEIIQSVFNKTQDENENEIQRSIVGIGINCTKPYYISSLSKRFTKSLNFLEKSKEIESDLSLSGPYLFLYPDGGLIWDGIQRVWKNLDGEIINEKLDSNNNSEGKLELEEKAKSKSSLNDNSNHKIQNLDQDEVENFGQIDVNINKVDFRAKQWAEPLRKIAEEVMTNSGDQADGSGWKGVFIGGCCKARAEDIKALSLLSEN